MSTSKQKHKTMKVLCKRQSRELLSMAAYVRQLTARLATSL